MEDDFLNIKISNNYNKRINIDRIFDEGYTTKGAGHGYGLPLVKKIIDGNDMFFNKMEYSEELFSQILLIKYKKNSNQK